MSLAKRLLKCCGAASKVARAFCFVMSAAAVAGPAAAQAPTPDTAEETRVISRQVLQLIQASKWAEAEVLAKKGLALCENAGSVKIFCESQFNESLGDIASAQARHSEALAYHQHALRTRVTNLDAGHSLIASSHLRVGHSYFALGRNDEAEIALKSAVAGFERLTPVNRALGRALSGLGRIFINSKRFEEAIAVGRRAVDVYIASDGIDARTVSIEKTEVAIALLGFSNQLYIKKDFAGAEKQVKEAIQSVELLSAGHVSNTSRIVLRRSFSLLGLLYRDQGQYDSAEKPALRALELTDRPDDDLPAVLANLALIYSQWGKPAKSIPYAIQAISVLEERKQENVWLGNALHALGMSQTDLGSYKDAETALVRAIEVFDRTAPEQTVNRRNARSSLGHLLTYTGRYHEAEQAYQSALAIPQTFALQRSPILAGLALIYRDTARYGEAKKLLLEAIPMEEAAGAERASELGMPG